MPVCRFQPYSTATPLVHRPRAINLAHTLVLLIWRITSQKRNQLQISDDNVSKLPYITKAVEQARAPEMKAPPLKHRTVVAVGTNRNVDPVPPRPHQEEAIAYHNKDSSRSSSRTPTKQQSSSFSCLTISQTWNLDRKLSYGNEVTRLDRSLTCL